MPAAGRRRRNAVLAPLVRWLWWSPTHLLSAVTGALLTVGLLLAAFRHTGARPAASPRTAHRPPAASAPALDAASASADPTTTARVAATAAATAATSASNVARQVASRPGASPAIRSAASAAGRSSAAPAAESDQAAARAAAASWVRLWARPALPAARWRRDLTASTFLYFRPQLFTTDPANITATRVAGVPRTVRFVRAAGVFDVPVNGPARAVRVTVIWYPTTAASRWVVSAVGPGRA